ncbi:MAG TPA: dienelactone hydrolase family protein [Bacteroidota bacterium]|nr:dienelactone hydrolase family protein [Bacteroidota bacterium]
MIPTGLLSLVLSIVPAASGQNRNSYSTVFYTNGSLRLEAYLFRPSGDGPFPVVIYNHGSRVGQERAERPFAYVGSLLTREGYGVLVPERRGYGKSEGVEYSGEVGGDVAEKALGRLRAESDDVLASLAFLKTVRWIDTTRIGIMGWSLGGIVSVFAASGSDRFFAVVDQAGGSLMWKRSPALQAALPEAAKGIRVPILCMAAENDATVEAVKSVAAAAKNAGGNQAVKIYPPFSPSQPSNIAPGHLIFSAEGMHIWGADVVAFFNEHRRR